jgi:hypothetical protein
MQPSYGDVSNLVKDKAKCGVAIVESEAITNIQTICNARTNDMLSSLDFKSSNRRGILKPNVHMNDPQVDVNMGHPLHWTAEKDHLEVAKEFSTNDQIDMNMGHPFHRVAKRGHLEVEEELLTND